MQSLVAYAFQAMDPAMVTFLSFLLACFLSTWPGNFLIGAVYTRVLSTAKSPVANKTMKEWLEELSPERDLAEFRSRTARIIGALERVIFIYALMFTQPSLITGVLILKAFFSWTEHRATADTEPKTRMLETIAHYHTYVIGNFLSLLTAIAAYQAASLWFPAWITKLI
jgi:hypothetical protein